MEEFKYPKNTVMFTVEGKYALFSEPVTRTGGEKSSYPVPTYEVLKGIITSVYWKPTITWVIDKVRVMNRIRTVSKSVKTRKWDKTENDLSIYTYLIDVKYQVQAHFEWNGFYSDILKKDQNEGKHFEIAKRSIAQGGRFDVFLGTRECQAYVYPSEFCSGEGYYDESGVIKFGLMFNGFTYPSENILNTNGNVVDEFLYGRFASVEMKNGIIEFPRADSFSEKDNSTSSYIYRIRPMKTKERKYGNV